MTKVNTVTEKRAPHTYRTPNHDRYEEAWRTLGMLSLRLKKLWKIKKSSTQLLREERRR